MKITTRLALVVALSLILAGAATLFVNAVAFQGAPYRTWNDYSNELLEEMHVSRAAVEREVARDPSILFGTPGETEANGVSIDEASRRAQENAIESAIARSRLLTALAVGAVAIGALTVGWLMSRRALRPIELMTARAKAASANDPGDRLALSGPNDEVKALADTIDEMMDRISRDHEAQRRFAEQAAHELRTPLATTRSEVEMLMAEVDDGDYIERLTAIADATDRADRMVAQLLVLARTQTGDLERSSFDLQDLVGNVLGRAVEGDQWSGVRLDFDLEAAPVIGDRSLIEILVRNLIDNAARYSAADGWVHVAVVPKDGDSFASVEVSNTIDLSSAPSEAIQAPPGRPGIGMSIVVAVVEAHSGRVSWRTEGDRVTATVDLPNGPTADVDPAMAVLAAASRAAD